MLNVKLHEMLRDRGLSVAEIAKASGVGRAHLTQVLNGRRTGRNTWKRLRFVMTEEELECARQFSAEELRKPEIRSRLKAMRKLLTRQKLFEEAAGELRRMGRPELAKQVAAAAKEFSKEIAGTELTPAEHAQSNEGCLSL